MVFEAPEPTSKDGYVEEFTTPKLAVDNLSPMDTFPFP
jgi:hypothetical protein